MDAARALFVAEGYAETGTPEIVAGAGVTRGALHHHFTDKLGLFRAVVERDASEVAAEISGSAEHACSPLEAMLKGAEAYFDAMSKSGRARLLLLEGPAVLGAATIDEIDRRTGRRQLRQGLELALNREGAGCVSLDALSTVLSAAFDRAALSIASGESTDDYRAALRLLIGGLPGLDGG